MIKFFRHIRKQLLSEGKTSKYLKYALGEIILVMIGILLALQVNNWNESKKGERAKLVYIDRLINDLKADTAAFIYHNKNVQFKIDNAKYISPIIEGKSIISNPTEFVYKLQDIGRIWSPVKSNNTFLDLQNSGGLSLFNNDSVVSALRKYYISDVAFWNAQYVKRTLEGILPIVIDAISLEKNEQIIRGEFGKVFDAGSTDYTVYFSEEEAQTILNKVTANPTFNFHLKNAVRTHTLQMRLNLDIITDAENLIALLQDYRDREL